MAINTDHGDVIARQTYRWFTAGVDEPTLVSSSETSTDGLRSWQSSFGLTNSSQTVYAGNGARYMTNMAPDGSTRVSYYLQGRLQSVTNKAADGTVLGQSSYGYDTLGRQNLVTDLRIGTTMLQFDDLDRVTVTTSPAPGNGQSAQSTTNYFDTLGRVWRTGLADGTSVTNEFFDTGEVKKTYGSRTYPVEYTFDYAGRMKTMKTWTNFASSAGAAVTTWNYDSQRGVLTSKRYNDNTGPNYTYTPGGRFYTRTWARSITTTYTTNSFGDIARINYSDATAGVTNSFDRLGRVVNTVDGAGSHDWLYDQSGRLLTETNTAGALAGLSVTNFYNELGLRTAVGLDGQASAQTTYGYDNASRLFTVANGDLTATYSYAGQTHLNAQ